MNKQNFFSRLLSNNIVLLVFSLLIAFAIWFVVNANSETESNVTISDIPITIELPEEAVEDGLQVFSGSETTASVEVAGNRITVGSLSAADIQIVALQSNSIIAPGNYTLELSAKKVGVKTNYNFVSNVSPPYINVYVDKLKEKTLTITDELVYKVEEGYYANTSLSETSVTISGPETEVASIEKAVVQGTLEGSANSTTTGSFDVLFLDKDGNVLGISMTTADVEKVDASLTPLPTQNVKLKLDVINAPKSYPLITMSPSEINIAAEQSVLDQIEDNEINIGTLNFANLSNKKTVMSYDITLPNGCKNLSESTSTKVTIDLSNYDRKDVSINNFTSTGVDLSQYNVTYNNGTDIIVCGPEDLISDITSANVIPMVDFTGKLEDLSKSSVSLELPLTFKFTSEYKECWVYGEYTVGVRVTKK